MLLKPGWQLAVGWTLASAAGWACAELVALLPGVSGDLVQAGYLRLAAGIIAAAMLQAILLRGMVQHVTWWIPVNLAAAALIGILVFGIGLVNTDVGWVLGAGLAGLVMGILQWQVLRLDVPRAGWWIVASALGWIVAGPLGGLLNWVGLGAVYGAISGTVLAMLMRQPNHLPA